MCFLNLGVKGLNPFSFVNFGLTLTLSRLSGQFLVAFQMDTIYSKCIILFSLLFSGCSYRVAPLLLSTKFATSSELMASPLAQVHLCLHWSLLQVWRQKSLASRSLHFSNKLYWTWAARLKMLLWLVMYGHVTWFVIQLYEPAYKNLQ